MDEGFNVLAEVLPSAGCMVDLLVALCEAVVCGEGVVAECEDHCVLD